jgi:2-polyprenyl-6-methoxyphenol hydroxylase-like FAD-dependent oxidoreductase
MTDVLISGAGVAGSTLAYWLARHGLRPTVVERAQGMRSSGNPVDVRGPAVPVAEAMGIMPQLRQAATTTTR